LDDDLAGTMIVDYFEFADVAWVISTLSATEHKGKRGERGKKERGRKGMTALL
jgi:hypothetical protein